MLSCILNSSTAIEVNIRVIRIFTRLREMVLTNKDILLKLEQIERKVGQHDDDIKPIFDYLKELLNPKTAPCARLDLNTTKKISSRTFHRTVRPRILTHADTSVIFM
jgi:hypothetical protein